MVAVFIYSWGFQLNPSNVIGPHIMAMDLQIQCYTQLYVGHGSSYILLLPRANYSLILSHAPMAVSYCARCLLYHD